jgi:hypothetical protein
MPEVVAITGALLGSVLTSPDARRPLERYPQSTLTYRRLELLLYAPGHVPQNVCSTRSSGSGGRVNRTRSGRSSNGPVMTSSKVSKGP